jgi:hexosaminidase
MVNVANLAGRRAHWALALVAIIPAPREVVESGAVFELRSDAVIAVTGGEDARRVAAQFTDRLAGVAGLALTIATDGSTAGATQRGSAAAPRVRFELQPGATLPAEGYRLLVATDHVTLTASDVAGLRHGAVTLWQLAAVASTAGGDTNRSPAAGSKPKSVTLPTVRIDDAPQFRWRGLMLDSARHYQSPAFIERYVDWMALHKFNVLHWHLTDDQAWRLEIERYPRLTEVGAWRVPAGRAAQRDLDPVTGKPHRYGGYYTPQTVRHLVQYAAERGITIVPEIEMPGHASATLAAYPDLGLGSVTPGVVPADWGIYTNLFNVEEATFAFFENVLREVMALFPGTYVHVGGDEAVKDQWRASPRVQERMRELGVRDEAALQGYFVARIGRFLAQHGRRLVGWDEILEGGIAPDATVMSWRGVDGARTAAQSGHDAVLAAWPTLYFDNRQGAAATEPPGRGRVVGLRDVYEFDTRVSGLTEEQLRHVIGVQGNVWTEHIRTEERVEWMTWPRAAAVAELGWTPTVRRDYADFRKRVEAALPWYRAVGLRAATTEFEMPSAAAVTVRRSQELELCSDKLVLNLEDDAPVAGPRARFLVDIMSPCWTWRGVDLARGATLIADVGQFPFNFQIGKDRDAIALRSPSTPSGELEVRADTCDGPLVASLPLAPAVDRDAVTRLPDARIEPRPGAQTLCFTFTGRTIDPMWAIDRVELRPLEPDARSAEVRR